MPIQEANDQWCRFLPIPLMVDKHATLVEAIFHLEDPVGSDYLVVVSRTDDQATPPTLTWSVVLDTFPVATPYLMDGSGPYSTVDEALHAACVAISERQQNQEKE